MGPKSAPRSEYQSRTTRKRLPRAVAKERALERGRRNSEAKRRAWVVLSDRHKDEFRQLFETELLALNEDRGPLPGDPK